MEIKKTHICIKCKEEKPLREFYVHVLDTNKRTKGGGTIRHRMHSCRKCRAKATAKAWRRNNKRRIKERNAYYWKHKSKYNPNRIEHDDKQ